MTTLTSRISPTDSEFLLNRAAYDLAIADLHVRRRRALEGGPPKAREKPKKHLARNNILPRSRVEALFDAGSPFRCG